MKLLIHAINGVGLGHLVRTVGIAQALQIQDEDVQIVFVTNSAFPELISREGFKVYPLKYHANMVLDGMVPYERYLRANYLSIRAVIKKERPDIILMDSEFNSPLVDFCHENKIKTCFVLRKTTDQNLDHLAQKGRLDKLDMILIPHLQGDIDPAQKNIFLKYRKVHFTGPIVRSAGESRKTVKGTALKILITFAAGSDITDNKEIFSKVSDLLATLKKQKMRIVGQKVAVSIVAGPLFREGTCDFHGFDHKKFEDDLPGVMAKCDLVVSPAGYNMINEIISTKTPALLVPLPRKEDDQHARAMSLEDKGCAEIVKTSIWDTLERLITEDKLGTMREAFPDIIQGNTNAARRLIELAQDKPRVLFLRAFWLPLSERFIYDELSFLRRYEPVVLCVHHDDKFEHKFEVLYDKDFSGLWNKDYPVIPQEKIDLHARMLQWAMSAIKARDIKILHAEFLSDAIFFMDLKRLSGLPLIVSVRGYDLYAKRSFDLAPVFAAADMFLVRSEIMKKDLLKQGCPVQKIFVQHSGIRLPAEAPLKEHASKEIRLLMAGRLVEKKGTLFGISIFNKLCEQFTHLKLYIIGNGPMRDAVLKAARQSPFAGKIVYCGEWPNNKVLELMRRCHLLLHPSLTASDGDKEGIPGVIMEAMANGLAVVASDNGSISEIVEHWKTGIIFKEGDIEDAVANTSFALRNMEGLETLKDKAWDKVRNGFNVIDQTSKLEVVYDSVLKGARWDSYERYYSNYRSVLDNGRPRFFRADIHPVQGCNSFCVMCDHWKRKKSEFLSKQQIMDTIKELKGIGTQEIRFHGHEPTLRGDLLELIGYVKSLGIWTGLKTNCLGLSREYCKSLAQLDKLYVSIDSPVASMHNKMRGNPSSFRENIKVMSWVKADNPDIILESNAVVTRLNYQTLGQMPSLAKRMGISRISFVLPNSKNKHEIANLVLRKEEMKEFFFKIVPQIVSGCMTHGIAFDCSPFFADLVMEDPRKIVMELKSHPEKFEEEINNYLQLQYGKTFYERYGCHGPLDHASINHDGNVYPCCVVERKVEYSVGNIAKDSFTQIWNSENYAGYREETVSTRGKCCENAAYCASNFSSRKFLSRKILSAPSKVASHE